MSALYVQVACFHLISSSFTSHPPPQSFQPFESHAKISAHNHNAATKPTATIQADAHVKSSILPAPAPPLCVDGVALAEPAPAVPVGALPAVVASLDIGPPGFVLGPSAEPDPELLAVAVLRTVLVPAAALERLLKGPPGWVEVKLPLLLLLLLLLPPLPLPLMVLTGVEKVVVRTLVSVEALVVQVVKRPVDWHTGPGAVAMVLRVEW